MENETKRSGRKVPVNVVLGQLGAGKTTVIMGLVKQIAGPNHKVIWIKNEYGDLNVDGALARNESITTEEIMNGCLCHTSIGLLEDSVRSMLKLNPDRIIIETAGSSNPAPIALELKQFSEISIDSLVEVIDCVNFVKFPDLSITGQAYAKYVDFVVLNKASEVDERRMDEVIDRVNDIYYGIPRFRTEDGIVPADVIFGLPSSITSLAEAEVRNDVESEHETHTHMHAFSCRTPRVFAQAEIEQVVESLPIEDVYRVKGFVQTDSGWKVFNSVANRKTWEDTTFVPDQTQLLFIGPAAEDHEKAVVEGLGLSGDGS